jgi:AraC-like DNA-binding protein
VDRRIQIVIALLEADTDTQPTINELADFVHLSPSRLSSIFKKETGDSLCQYLKLQKMWRAKCLLENTFLSVKEVMALVGLSDISHFVRDFKQLFGATPREYRNHHLNADSIIRTFESRAINSANKWKVKQANSEKRQRTLVAEPSR